jgi:PAS domain S-box-containing protein
VWKGSGESMCQIEINLSEDLIYWSDEAFLILNWDSKSPIITHTKRLKEVIHPQDKFTVLSAFAKALPDKADLDLNFRILNRQNRAIKIHCLGKFSINTQKKQWLRCIIFPVETHSPPINLSFYKSLVEKLPFSVCLINSAKVFYANEACLAMFGYQSNQDVFLSSVFDFHAPASKKKTFQILHSSYKKTGEIPSRIQSQFIRSNGSVFDSEVYLSNNIFSNKRFVQAVIIDVSRKNKLEQREKQVALDALYLNQKNRVLSDIEKELNKIVYSNNSYRQKDFLNIYNIINSSKDADNDWQLFSHYFDNLYPEFLKKLKQKSPLLTTNDIRLCVCLKLNLGTKETARFFNVKASSIQIARVRLKKKFNLPKDIDLWDFIQDL